MDELGISSSWFLELNATQIYKFLFELYEIWTFRAQLSSNIKREICPPYGNPFIHCNNSFLSNMINQRNINYYSLYLLKNIAYKVMYKLVFSSSNDSNKNMGVLYILSSLTLVSENVRNSLP